MTRPRLRARSLVTPPAGAALVALCLAACSGGGGDGLLSVAPPDEQVSIQPLELQAVGPPLHPLGVVGEQTVAWRSNQAVSYEIQLLTGGSAPVVELLASGVAAAYETVSVDVAAADLDGAGARVEIQATDSIGRQVVSDLTLDLAEVDEFLLGVGDHVDLAYDATRDELLVANRLNGFVQVIDVDPDSPGYGAVVAGVPPGPDAGPLAVAATPDGALGFNLNRTTLLSYDLSTFTFEDNLYLPGGFEPTSIIATPDSQQLYIGYYHTLLFHDVYGSDPPQVQSTGLTDGLIDGGDVAVTPDGSLVLYAWFGGPNRGLWIVDADPTSPDYHDLLGEKILSFPPPPNGFAPVLPMVAVAPSGEAAYTGAPTGLARIDLTDPAFPITDERPELEYTGLTSVSVGGQDLVVLTLPFSGLVVLDDSLELLGSVELPPILVDRSAVDAEGGRLFLVSQQQQTSGTLLIVPLL